MNKEEEKMNLEQLSALGLKPGTLNRLMRNINWAPWGRLPTLHPDELREMSDEQLLSCYKIGKVTLMQLREVLGPRMTETPWKGLTP